MAVFEKTIIAGIGVQAEVSTIAPVQQVEIEAGIGLYAEVVGQVPIHIEIEAEIGLSGFGEYEHIPRTVLTNVIWADAMEKNRDNPEKAAKYLQEKVSFKELRKVSTQKKILQIQRLSLQERAGEIANLSEYGHEAEIWCADYTDDLTGDIGTIEVPGEQTARNIQPGYNANAVYDSERDGQMLPAIVNTPAGVFWNLAMLPGWQKWKPTFRYGTITAIDYGADTCSLTLEAATSTQQNIDVNQGTTLTAVPIEYMYCDSKVFEVDDVVLIKFTGQDYDSPKVIGFKSHPKRCTQWVMFKCYVINKPARYVVWDAHENGFADLSNWGGPAVAGDYPCEAADLAAWIAATSQASTSQCFNTVR